MKTKTKDNLKIKISKENDILFIFLAFLKNEKIEIEKEKKDIIKYYEEKGYKKISENKKKDLINVLKGYSLRYTIIMKELDQKRKKRPPIVKGGNQKGGKISGNISLEPYL